MHGLQNIKKSINIFFPGPFLEHFRNDFRLPPRVNEIFAVLKCYAAMIDVYRRFGTTYRFDLQRPSSPKRMIVYPRNVGNYKFTLYTHPRRAKSHSPGIRLLY